MLAALAAICFVAFFWRLGACSVFDLDEGLYVAVAREMALSGDYVTPRVNGRPFYEKPPAAYWSAALSMRFFGRSELAARLPNALAMAALVALVYLFGVGRFGRRAAFLAASFLALSPLVLGAGRQLTMDAQLTLWITVALLSVQLGQAAFGVRRAVWHAAFWAACGMAVLTKGVVGAALPCATVAVWLSLRHRRDLARMLTAGTVLRAAGGIALLLLIAAPWHVAAWEAGGGPFVQEYLVRQHLQRFRGGDVAHLAPFWFFVPGLFLGAIPWSGFLPSALRWREPGDAEGDGTPLLLTVWAVLVFLFFSASGSKLISYILPLFPAAALLAGRWCDAVLDGKAKVRALVGGLVAGLIVAALVLALLVARDPLVAAAQRLSHRPVVIDPDTAAVLAWGVRQSALLVVVCGTAAVLAGRGRAGAALGVVVAGMATFAALAAGDGLHTIDSRLLRPLHDLSRMAASRALPHERIIVAVGPPRRPSVLFYLPDRYFTGGLHATETAAETEVAGLLAGGPALLLIERARAERLGLLGSPMRAETLGARGRWMLLRVTRVAARRARHRASGRPTPVLSPAWRQGGSPRQWRPGE